MLYSAAYGIVLAFLFPFEYRKRDKSVRKKWVAEKLGNVYPSAATLASSADSKEAADVLWVHAVSVGEVIVASSFIAAFKEKYPDFRIVVSTITDTGQKVAREKLGKIAEIIYMPFDLEFALRRALSKVRPSIFAIMETEIWPNTFKVFSESGVPVVLLNGRISDHSFSGYKKITYFIKRVLRNVDLFCMQDETYAQRIIELGADANKVIITGSFKFDIKVKDEELGWMHPLRSRPLLAAGSTHKGEDELMISVFGKLKNEFTDLAMVLAPRHPERVEHVEKILKESEVPYVRRSRMTSLEEMDISVVLLDTVGELSSVYRDADVAIIGGSFLRHGGQNFLEPAYWGKPVVCGPHMENFPYIKEFYEGGAALEADNDSLYNVLRDLLVSPERMQRIGARAKELVNKNRGAVEKSLRAVGEQLVR